MQDTTKRPHDDALNDKRVLIVEDDTDIARILRDYAESHGCRAYLAPDGEEALRRRRAVRPDIILLDVNLPKRDGFEVLEAIRASSDTPVIIISARIEDEDKLNGLGLGADDYVVKPFNPSEVVARIKAVLHRADGRVAPKLLRRSGITVDLDDSRVVYQNGARRTVLNLTPSEYKILLLLMQTPNKVFSRGEILGSCFPESDALERTVDSHVSHLRKKLHEVGAADLVSVRRGFGYRFGDR
ncbi:MAG: response regulator [Pseudomonadota bacterium]